MRRDSISIRYRQVSILRRWSITIFSRLELLQDEHSFIIWCRLTTEFSLICPSSLAATKQRYQANCAYVDTMSEWMSEWERARERTQTKYITQLYSVWDTFSLFLSPHISLLVILRKYMKFNNLYIWTLLYKFSEVPTCRFLYKIWRFFHPKTQNKVYVHDWWDFFCPYLSCWEKVWRDSYCLYL